MKEKIYAEIGIGNGSFLSTEIEKGKFERREKGLVLPKKITEFYFRFWIAKGVLILSTKDGVKTMKKKKENFKILFGIGGEK